MSKCDLGAGGRTRLQRVVAFLLSSFQSPPPPLLERTGDDDWATMAESIPSTGALIFLSIKPCTPASSRSFAPG